MESVSRVLSSRRWVTLCQLLLLAANLLAMAVEETTWGSGSPGEACRKPSAAWNFSPVFSRTLAAVKDVSYEACVSRQRHRHLRKALVADAFVLFMRLRTLYTFLRLCIPVLRRQNETRQPSPEENVLECQPSPLTEKKDPEKEQTSPDSPLEEEDEDSYELIVDLEDWEPAATLPIQRCATVAIGENMDAQCSELTPPYSDAMMTLHAGRTPRYADTEPQEVTPQSVRVETQDPDIIHYANTTMPCVEVAPQNAEIMPQNEAITSKPAGTAHPDPALNL